MNNNNYINNLQQLLAMGNNPQQIVQNAIARNPQLQQVFSQIGGNGMTAKAMVMQIAQQQGIDVNQMLQFLQQKGIKM
jgi:hypothetical protein